MNLRAYSFLKRYGFIGSIRLFTSFLYTRLLHKSARMIRLPCYIRSDHKIELGRRMTTGVGLRLDVFESGKVEFGNNIEINDYVHIAAIEHVSIGDDTLIASRVFISDHNHGRFDTNLAEHGAEVPPAQRPLHSKPVVIGNRVWIGEGVCILPGVTVGDGAVIGAGSVVTRDVPENCVAAGNPARVLRRYDSVTHEWQRV